MLLRSHVLCCYVALSEKMRKLGKRGCFLVLNCVYVCV